MFIVPRQRLAVLARYLSSHYWDLRCWAFPRPEREAFDQKESIAKRVVESFPPLYRPSENGHNMPRLPRKPLGRHTGSGPLPRSPPGNHRRRGDGHRQDLHRHYSSRFTFQVMHPVELNSQT